MRCLLLLFLKSAGLISGRVDNVSLVDGRLVIPAREVRPGGGRRWCAPIAFGSPSSRSCIPLTGVVDVSLRDEQSKPVKAAAQTDALDAFNHGHRAVRPIAQSATSATSMAGISRLRHRNCSEGGRAALNRCPKPGMTYITEGNLQHDRRSMSRR